MMTTQLPPMLPIRLTLVLLMVLLVIQKSDAHPEPQFQFGPFMFHPSRPRPRAPAPNRSWRNRQKQVSKFRLPNLPPLPSLPSLPPIPSRRQFGISMNPWKVDRNFKPLVKFRKSKQPTIGFRCNIERNYRKRCRLTKQGRSLSTEIVDEISFSDENIYGDLIENKEDSFTVEELSPAFRTIDDDIEENGVFDENEETFYVYNDNDQGFGLQDEWDTFEKFGFW